MMASRTPGDLGVYCFRNRVDHSYDNLVVADGSAIHAPRLWDVATRYGIRLTGFAFSALMIGLVVLQMIAVFFWGVEPAKRSLEGLDPKLA